MYLLIKVQETAWSTSYGENKTYKQSNDLLHPLMGKITTPRSQSPLLPLIAPKTKARRSNTLLQTREEKQVLKQNQGKKQTLRRPPKTKEKKLQHKVLMERKGKTTTAGCLTVCPLPSWLWDRCCHGQGARKISDTSDFSMGQGGSAIP